MYYDLDVSQCAYILEYYYFRIEKERAIYRYTLWLLIILAHFGKDDVLPEYVVLLLANRHPREKILSDLEGLLGDEVSLAFTNWLFLEVERLMSMMFSCLIVDLFVLFRWIRHQ